MKKNFVSIYDSCTVVYIGKNVAKDHTAMIARTDDGSPLAAFYSLKIYPRDALKNKLIHGVNGFSFKMPNKTYRYISTPMSPCTHKGKHWDVSTINENAVGVSATLTCHTNKNAMAADPFPKTGISEDNLAQIPGALATSARNAMEIVAKIVDKSGMYEATAIFATDQKETWYMEIYSGHQYVAVKLPDDVAFTVGNEFILATLKDFKKNEYITSKDLFNLPKKKGFAKYQGPHDNLHMHLSETYGVKLFDHFQSNNVHRRTWIGYRIFAPRSKEAQTYIPTKRYEPFVKPERNDLTIHDMIKTLRNRFDGVLDNPKFKEFRRDLDLHHLRLLAAPSGLQIHAIRSYANLPKEIACQEWLAFSNSNFSPFIPLNNGVNSVSKPYSYIAPIYDYDENSPTLMFKRLNLLAHFNWKCYGDQIAKMWETYEAIYDHEYQKMIKKVKKMPLADAKAIITQYCNYVQEETFMIAKYTFNDLMMHMMNEQNIYLPNREIPIFHPFVNLEQYVKHFNWSYHWINQKEAILKKGKDICVIKPAECISRAKGSLTYKNKKYTIQTRIRNNQLYIAKNNIDNVIKLKDIKK
ncbi:MAG: C69 family dipeptidase [Bacilli bacterium]|nr:C69 family dipeptidase [Bacilli bacterium]